MIQVSDPHELQLILNRLKEYGFKDSLGHPLENCVDFQEMIALCRQMDCELLHRQHSE